MVGFVRAVKHPYSPLTHHGLIKILILRDLAQRNQTWEKFTSQPQIAQGPIPLHEIPIREVRAPIPLHEIPIREVRAPTLLLNVQLEEEQEDRIPSNLVGGS